MFKNFIVQQAILTIILPSNFVLATEELLSNSTLPDTKVFKCTTKVKVGEFDSQIDLCSLEGNQFLRQKISSGEKRLASIKIQRYYCINPFGRIRSTSNHHKSSSYLPDLPPHTNCPTYSTSCLVSHVTFPCDNDQDDNDVCLSDQITADSYGYQKKWNSSIAPKSGMTASITMKGGPCYYCSDSKKKLQTTIAFYCDERRTTGKGKAIIKQNPTKSIPEVLVQWNTSEACYQFIPKQKCTFRKFNFFDEYCQPQKPFSCNKEYQYVFPRSANKSIISTNYVFGFCARNVQCSSGDKNVLICRKDGQGSKALAYYSDSIDDAVARPTGFVIRIRSGLLGGSLKAVISFECSDLTGDIEDMTVLDSEDALPILLVLKHHCFCPNSCQESSTLIPQSSTESSEPSIIFQVLGGGVCVFLLNCGNRDLHEKQKH